jgi:hypothetical protein
MMKNFGLVFALLLSLSILSFAIPFDQSQKESFTPIKPQISLPYKRPIGFSLNVGGISSMTFEGRFLLGLFPHIVLVASPSYQNTPLLPLYHFQENYWALFDIKRLNMGLGLRGHFYEYDSWDGFYIEAMGRGGLTWVAKEDYMWSVIPSLIFGYSSVYQSGYTVSVGIGLEYEFLLSEPHGEYSKFLKTAIYGVTKAPPTGELSLGWTW